LRHAPTYYTAFNCLICLLKPTSLLKIVTSQLNDDDNIDRRKLIYDIIHAM